MSEVQKPSEVVKAQILQDPNMVLQDSELMQALIGAGGDASDVRNVVDLRGRLVERLEDRLDRLEDAHRTVIAAAYENLSGTQQVHRTVLALLEPVTFKGFLEVLGEDVRHMLGVDVVRLVLETSATVPGKALGPDGPHEGLMIAASRGGIDEYITNNPELTARKVTLRTCRTDLPGLYDPQQDLMQSEALMKLDLGSGNSAGMLVLGSQDAKRFTPDQGVDLLTFFAGAFERILRRWLA